jgi:two-component system response regulator
MDGRRLLLVEDNRDDEALIRRALRKADLVPLIVVAHDGAQAIEYLQGKKFRAPATMQEVALPDVILLDLNLPKLSGFDVLRRIRGDPRTRLLPVIILTSSREERDIISSYELGASSYIRKPMTSEQFIDAIRQLGLYWLRLNESPHSAYWVHP